MIRTTEKELVDALLMYKNDVIINGIYYHYKNHPINFIKF